MPEKTKVTSFLDLPAEIRNEIYELAIVEDSGNSIDVSSNRLREPALTRSHPQIRGETLPIFYGNHNLWASTQYQLIRFLTGLGSARRAMLRSVQLGTEIERLNDAYVVLRGLFEVFVVMDLPRELEQIVRVELPFLRSVPRRRVRRSEAEKAWVLMEELKGYEQVEKGGMIFKEGVVEWRWDKQGGGIKMGRPIGFLMGNVHTKFGRMSLGTD